MNTAVAPSLLAWGCLLLAGIFEIGWPLGLKISQAGAHRWAGIVLAVVSMSASGAFLWLAQREIPIGTAYAVWTGIGAAGTFLVGVIFYGDSASLARIIPVLLIVGGVIGLKLAH